MNTEPMVSPGEETQNPAPETETPEIVTPESEATPETEEGDSAEKAIQRMQRRIDRRTSDYHRVRAENEQLRARLSEGEPKSGKQDQPSDKQPDPITIAREIARAERFAEQANSLVETGAKKHNDFKAALNDLAVEVGPFVMPNGLPSPFMEVVTEAVDKSAQADLLYYLGKNPDVAAELADMTPIQQAKRLVRIESELDARTKPKTSSAPKPLAPVKGVSSDSELGPGLSDAEWMRRREAQLKERRG